MQNPLANFSTLNMLAYALARATGNAFWQRASYVAMWGAASAFYAAGILFPDSYAQQRRKLGMSVNTFRVANVVYHIAPIYLCRVPPVPYANAAGVCWHVGWGVAVSRGTLDLSSVYVPLPARQYRILWVFAVAAMALA